MIGIAYLSSAVRPPQTQEVEEILAVSRRNNEMAGITGLLCHFEGSFLQFLEGPGEAVDTVFDRIAADPRHHSILKLYRSDRMERLFPDWSMAVARPDKLSPETAGFARGLRGLEPGLATIYETAVTPFLTSFRAWMR